MTKKIKWRLSELPTGAEVAELVKEGVLSKEEAREILFTQEEEDERSKKSLEEEIKFLRELVAKLSNNSRVEIVKQIEYIEMPYRKRDWWRPYEVYCSADKSNALYTVSGGTNGPSLMSYSQSSGASTANLAVVDYDFTKIKSF